MIRLGVIGFGNRIGTTLKHMALSNHQWEITAVCDLRDRQEIELMMAERLPGLSLENTRFYTDADVMLAQESLDGVIIGTRCDTHAEMACKVLDKKLPLMLEKPVATNMADLIKLHEAGLRNPEVKTVVAFVLRYTPIVEIVKELVDSGKIGRITHMEAVNDVTYGGVYFWHWFRDENVTGGLFLQKATHDIDYLTWIAGERPEVVAAMASKQHYRGDHPAGLQCRDCLEKGECPESICHDHPYRRRQGKYESCAFAVDTGNHDSAGILLRYANGMHLSYTQDFVVRRAPRRGARIIGDKGCIDFDFNTNEVDLTVYHYPRREKYTVDSSVFPDNHYGGDPLYCKNFLDVIAGEAESMADLTDGITSALICLKAEESAGNDRFEKICFPNGEKPWDE